MTSNLSIECKLFSTPGLKQTCKVGIPSSLYDCAKEDLEQFKEQYPLVIELRAQDDDSKKQFTYAHFVQHSDGTLQVKPIKQKIQACKLIVLIVAGSWQCL